MVRVVSWFLIATLTVSCWYPVIVWTQRLLLPEVQPE
jgi:hypothetical protein